MIGGPVEVTGIRVQTSARGGDNRAMSHRFVEPAGREIVEVLVSDWEIECCAPPPVVGETTSWMLQYVACRGAVDPLLDHELTWSVSRWAGAPAVTRLDRGAVTAYWSDDEHRPPPGEVLLRGRTYGTVHGGISPDGFPQLEGRVERVRVLSQEYREVAERRWEGVPGSVTAVDVRESPRWFTTDSSLCRGSQLFGVLLDVRVRTSRA